MNKLIFKLFLALFLFGTTHLMAQSPQNFNYQAVVRDASGNITASKPANLRFIIRTTDIAGAIEYEETVVATTNAYGMINHAVGTGAPVTGTFSAINWGASAKFLQVKVALGTDPEVDLGGQTLGSVPYALFAGGSDWTKTGNNISSNNSGNVGIGTNTPNSKVTIIVPDNKNNDPADNGIYVYNNGTAGDNDDAIIAARVNGAGSGDPFTSYDIAGVTGWSTGIDNSDGDKFKIANAWSDPGTNTRLTIATNGFTGFSVSDPHALLHLENSVVNRKIILFESANNDHQYYGFGINNGTLRYQVDATGANHVFFAATSATASNELMRIQGDGNVNIGNYGKGSSTYLGLKTSGGNLYQAGLLFRHFSDGYGYTIQSNEPTTQYRIVRHWNNTSGVVAFTLDGFNGNVGVINSLSKGGGSFKIDHPLDPSNKFLYHSFVESPDMMNIYNGNITTDDNGIATVTLPDYFEALNLDYRYQLTVIGTFAQAIIYSKVKQNSFEIKTDKPNVEVSWQVTGIRHDAWANKNRIPTTVEKTGEDKGKYLHPESFNLSDDMLMPSLKGNVEENNTVEKK